MDNTILAKGILQITRHGYYEEQVEKITHLLDSVTAASNGANPIISGSLPPALDLQQEAEEAWERENREFSNPNGINPYAYVLGYKAGAKRKCR